MGVALCTSAVVCVVSPHPETVAARSGSSAACQPRYVAADGKCAFALRLYGSAEAPPTATAFDQLDEDQRRSGDDYSLEVSACTLRAAPPSSVASCSSGGASVGATA